VSYPILTLPKGLGWNFKTSQLFTTTRQKPQSGRGPVAATLQQGVLYEFELVCNYLKVAGVTTANDFAYLKNFYEAMRGAWGRFVFDPSQANLSNLTLSADYTQLENGFSGIGDGVTTVFPLWRSTSALGGGNVTLLERIQNVSTLIGVYVNNVLQSSGAYTLTNFPASITFTTAPATGYPVCWSGNYNYLCSFAEDTNDLNEFMWQLYELKSLRLETVNL
jgi:hypothetical protein